MTREELLRLYDHFDDVPSYTTRVFLQFFDFELSYRPGSNALTVLEIAHHMFSNEKLLALSAGQSGFTDGLARAVNAELAGLSSIQKVIDYADDCHRVAHGILAELHELNASVPLPPGFGKPEAPLWEFFVLAYQEHWHHRGQLTIDTRLLGRSVVDIYAYDRSIGS